MGDGAAARAPRRHCGHRLRVSGGARRVPRRAPRSVCAHPRRNRIAFRRGDSRARPHRGLEPAQRAPPKPPPHARLGPGWAPPMRDSSRNLAIRRRGRPRRTPQARGRPRNRPPSPASPARRRGSSFPARRPAEQPKGHKPQTRALQARCTGPSARDESGFTVAGWDGVRKGEVSGVSLQHIYIDRTKRMVPQRRRGASRVQRSRASRALRRTPRTPSLSRAPISPDRMPTRGETRPTAPGARASTRTDSLRSARLGTGCSRANKRALCSGPTAHRGCRGAGARLLGSLSDRAFPAGTQQTSATGLWISSHSGVVSRPAHRREDPLSLLAHRSFAEEACACGSREDGLQGEDEEPGQEGQAIRLLPERPGDEGTARAGATARSDGPRAASLRPFSAFVAKMLCGYPRRPYFVLAARIWGRALGRHEPHPRPPAR